RRDVMRDLSGITAQPHTAVERRGAEPHWPPLLPLREDLPEAHMVASIRTVAEGFFEREIFAPAVIEKRTDRRVPIRLVQHDPADDFHARPERNRIGGIPSSRMHRAQDIFFLSDQTNIDWPPRNILGGARPHQASRQSFLMLIV